MDNAWLQAWSTAVGASALLQLQSAFQAASEVLDRKSAYALAVFSLYFAMIASSSRHSYKSNIAKLPKLLGKS